MTEKRKDTGMADTLRITAEPLDITMPTVGPWIVVCSHCGGAVVLCLTTADCDLSIITHTKLHGGDA